MINLASVIHVAFHLLDVVLILLGVLVFTLVFLLQQFCLPAFLDFRQILPLLLCDRLLKFPILPHSVLCGVSQDREASSYSKLLPVVPIPFEVRPVLVGIPAKPLLHAL